jgi:hypothetical protein
MARTVSSGVISMSGFSAVVRITALPVALLTGEHDYFFNDLERQIVCQF